MRPSRAGIGVWEGGVAERWRKGDQGDKSSAGAKRVCSKRKADSKKIITTTKGDGREAREGNS